ncbi:MAG: UbiA family prenyltransferase [Gordonia sp. (in: high G+C Gram-positive bacteria)]|uniref:UbiA family prenyltransferase n=1 Tax=Gordonia sp. (in: high G+C Gram-positive bacteria) TaxID=84139 RepID=UPI003BB4F25C
MTPQHPSERRNENSVTPWIGVLKISRVPFWFLWTSPLLIGYLGSAHDYGAHHVAWFVLVMAGVWTGDAVASIHNELVDREEDAINQPERSVLLASMRQQTLWFMVFVGYVSLAVGAVAFAVAVGWLPALVVSLGALAAPLYNWGPRFKRRPPMPQIVFAWVAFCETTGGWLLNAPLSTLTPAVAVVALFIAVASVAKDLPDAEGDEAVGAASVFSIRNARVRRSILIAIHVSPYLLLVALISGGIVPKTMLWVCTLLPAALAIVWLGERAATQAAKVLTYELAYLYVHVFLLGLLIAGWPSLLNVTVAVVMLVARLAAVAARLEPRFVGEHVTLRAGVRDLFRKPAPST